MEFILFDGISHTLAPLACPDDHSQQVVPQGALAIIIDRPINFQDQIPDGGYGFSTVERSVAYGPLVQC
jgi:hypothetical protein